MENDVNTYIVIYQRNCTLLVVSCCRVVQTRNYDEYATRMCVPCTIHRSTWYLINQYYSILARIKGCARISILSGSLD